MQSVKRSFSSGMSSDWEAVEMYLITYAELSLLLRLFPYIPPAPPNKREMKKNGLRTSSNQNQIMVPFHSDTVLFRLI